MACETVSDQHGTTYYIADVEVTKDAGGHLLPSSASIEVWWHKTFRDSRNEVMIIKQENGPHVDVLSLTFGQVYDLIDALNRAVENS